MPGMMFIPPQQSPLEDFSRNMGNLITQLALMKISQNFREKEAATEALRADTREQTRLKTAAAMEGWRTAEGEEQRARGSGAVEIGGTKMMPSTPETVEIPGTSTKIVKIGGKYFPIQDKLGYQVLDVNGKKAVMQGDGTIKFLPEKTPAANPNQWQAIVNDPNSTPQEKAIAQKNLVDMEERQKRIVATSGVARAAGYKGLSAIQVANPETGEIEWAWAGQAIPGFPKVPGLDFGPEGKGGKPSALSPQTPTFAAGKSALSQLEAQEGKVLAFAEAAERNLDIALKLSEKVDRTGVPVINRWLLAGQKSIAGDEDVAAFDAALRVGINEFARVTTTATGGGVTSDQARREVEDMLKNSLTPGQIKSVITNVLYPDMENRRAGYRIQRAKIKSRLGGGTAGPESPTEDKPLPKGLSESDIQFNMKKYGKTRQEVIDKFNAR